MRLQQLLFLHSLESGGCSAQRTLETLVSHPAHTGFGGQIAFTAPPITHHISVWPNRTSLPPKCYIHSQMSGAMLLRIGRDALVDKRHELSHACGAWRTAVFKQHIEQQSTVNCGTIYVARVQDATMGVEVALANWEYPLNGVEQQCEYGGTKRICSPFALAYSATIKEWWNATLSRRRTTVSRGRLNCCKASNEWTLLDGGRLYSSILYHSGKNWHGGDACFVALNEQGMSFRSIPADRSTMPPKRRLVYRHKHLSLLEHPVSISNECLSTVFETHGTPMVPCFLLSHSFLLYDDPYQQLS